MNGFTRLNWLKGLGAIALSLLLAACGGSGGSTAGTGAATATGCIPGDASTADACGSIVVALTDAEGDFASYAVDIDSILLERGDGSLVEILPQTARIDFAQLTALSELVGHASVPPGAFVAGRIRIDYSEAEVFVESGGDIVPALVYDTDGRLLTSGGTDSVVEVEIELPASDRLFVSRGQTALLSIDFDLAASHIVDTSVTPATATAQPYLVAETRPVDEKEIRVRGAVTDVDVAAGTYTVAVRPWHERVGDFGRVSVITTDTTVFEIDETNYTGQAGLTALASQPAGTVAVALGTLDLNDRSFTATVVHAGDSVGGTRHTAVLGNIVSRSGDSLVLKGAIAIRHDRPAHFHRTVVVSVGPDTIVAREYPADSLLDKDDLSVGQRVQIFGQLTNPAVDNSDRFGPDIALELDATNGRARMLTTQLTGTVNRADAGSIEISLRAIDRLSVGMFDFSGTGLVPDLDADPTAYEIATSTLSADALVAGRTARVRGFVTAFGDAPPDFEATAIIGPRDLPAILGAGFGSEGTAAPFATMSAASLVIDLDNPDIGERHHLLIGHEVIDLFDLPGSPAITASTARRVYGIWEPGHVELFKSFGDFVDALALRLSNTDRARSLSAYGRYDESGNTLAANKIVVHMLPAPSP